MLRTFSGAVITLDIPAAKSITTEGATPFYHCWERSNPYSAESENQASSLLLVALDGVHLTDTTTPRQSNRDQWGTCHFQPVHEIIKQHQLQELEKYQQRRNAPGPPPFPGYTPGNSQDNPPQR